MKEVDPKEVSATEETRVKTVPQPKQAWQKHKKTALFTLLLLFGLALSFCAGMQVEKHHGNAGRFANRHSFMHGTQRQPRGAMTEVVTAISATSITVKNEYEGLSKTYAIDSNTKATKDGSMIAITDVKPGDRVIVLTGSTTSTTAVSIEVNPHFSNSPADSLDTSDSASDAGNIIN